MGIKGRRKKAASPRSTLDARRSTKKKRKPLKTPRRHGSNLLAPSVPSAPSVAQSAPLKLPASSLPVWWEVFAVEYIKGKENGAAAYRLVKPHVSDATAWRESARLLRDPRFIPLLERHRKTAMETVAMSRDEWFRLLAEKGRGAITNFLHEDGRLNVEALKARQDRHIIRRIEFEALDRKDSDPMVYVSKVEADDAQSALVTLGKAAGYVQDPKVKMQADGKGGFTVQWDKDNEVV